jgi:glycosyltransferase involved in cell wall biosynthesis
MIDSINATLPERDGERTDSPNAGPVPATAAPRDVILITWMKDQPRSAGLARALGAEAIWMPWAWPRLPWPRRILSWLRSAGRTASVVRRAAPGTLVVAMSPPVFNPLVAWAACRRRNDLTFAIDLHSGALNDPNWSWAFGLQRWLIARSDAVIVTNREIIRGVDVGASRVIAMHDPWAPDEPAAVAEIAHPYALFPASGMPDEPVEALADAARLLEGRVQIVVTGRARPELSGTPVVSTGFVPEADFEGLLREADVVLALTTREGTMQRAAYEALHVGRPLVCSDTAILVEELGTSAVFTPNDGPSIAAAIDEALDRSDELVKAGTALIEEMDAGIDAAVLELLATTPARSHPRSEEPSCPLPES